MNKKGTAEIVETALETKTIPIVIAGTEKLCLEDAYENRPEASTSNGYP